MRCQNLLSIALSLILVVGVAACGGGGNTVEAGPPAASPWPTVAPEILNLSTGMRTLDVSWTPVEGATAYGVYLATQSGLSPKNYWSLPEHRVVAVSGATSATITDLVDGATYWCVVAARSDFGEGPASASASGTLAPGAVSKANLTAIDSGARLSWVGARGATTYDAYVANVPTVNSATWDTLPGGMSFLGVSSPITVTGLATDLPAYAVIVARNDSGRGPDSPVTTLTPGAAYGLKLTAGNAEAVFTWNPVPAAISYDVYVADVGNLTSAGYASLPGGRRIQDAVSPLLLTDLQNGKTVYAMVVARSTGVQGPDSSVVSATPSGRGTFLDGGTVGTGSGTQDTLLLDMDYDGVLDLVVTNRGDNSVAVLLGSTDGTFGTPTTYKVGQGPVAVAAADVNYDSYLDLVTADEDGGTVSVLLGTSDGGFQDAYQYYPGVIPTGIFAMALGGQWWNAVDLVIFSRDDSMIVVMQGDGWGWFDDYYYDMFYYYTDRNPVHPIAADFDGDGRVDVMTANSGSGTISFFSANGYGGFYDPVTSTAGTSPTSLTIADFDADYVPDLLVTDAANDTVFPMINAGDGTFSEMTALDTGPSPTDAVVGDFDGDGNLDAAILCPGAPCVTILLGDGAGGVLSRADYTVCGTPVTIVCADFNGDGVLDLAVSDSVNGHMDILFGSPV